MAAHIRRVMRLNVFLWTGRSIVVEQKRYVRGLKRKPVRVLFPENDTDNVFKITPKSQPAVANVKRERALKAAETSRHEESHFVKTRDDEHELLSEAGLPAEEEGGRLRFERAFPGDKRLARVVSVARSRAFREHQGKILLEGRRLISDALDAGANPQIVFFSQVDRLKELPLDKLKRATLVKVKFEDIKIWSELVTPQGVIAIFSRPNPSRLNFINRDCSVPLTLICDNIRDPGNLGTILRSAAAAGCHDVLLTKGCVDAWEPKVLRAAMGAHFRLPIHSSLKWEDVENHLPQSAIVHVADSNCGPDASKETKDSQVNLSRKTSKAGDFGWISTRSNHKNMRYEEYDSDSDSDSDTDSDSDSGFDADYEFPEVETKLYHESWAHSPVALVIGGETWGLSPEAVQLAKKTSGHRLFIPVVPEVNSLNSAMAASVLLFEGRKQLLKVIQTSGRNWKSKA
ncbi:rRNA methyltransferase 3A, mitochondrial [Brachionichthys hirsutus]|uniref:rRNA methyltransferase 3A, mitochondrial n=1 Tax=Brachionichthys hirsutus TaxID=412623 RepID=UPI0036047E6A